MAKDSVGNSSVALFSGKRNFLPSNNTFHRSFMVTEGDTVTSFQNRFISAADGRGEVLVDNDDTPRHWRKIGLKAMRIILVRVGRSVVELDLLWVPRHSLCIVRYCVQ